jgi:N-acetylglucosaminyldiphosphoundecaprenol N-acetyl-beta-D-mannosaminyltransferase
VGLVRIVGLSLQAGRFDEAVNVLIDAAHARRRIRGHFCTAHTAVEANANPALMAALRSADLVLPDGMPLVWIARRRGQKEAERCAGPDVMVAVCDRGRAAGLSHYFVGGAPGTPEALASSLADRYPGLQVAGTHSPPFRDASPAEDASLVAAINAAGPDVLWIGLGTPKQDLWAAEHAAILDAPVILTVGAAFDFHSGRLRRAPHWMRRVGLEWLFRLAMEPRRLWRRYLLTNARFVWLVVREEIARRRLRPIDRR